MNISDADLIAYSLRGDSIVTKTQVSPTMNGLFWLLIRYPEHKGDTLRLMAAHEKYDTAFYDLPVSVGKRVNKIDLESPIFLKRKPAKLKELTVTASKIKFYYRGDTLVYNADAFLLPEGSMLDALIGQLPGVELKSNGQIFVNGKLVDDLLLNGKGFMSSDKRLLLDNLGAFTVKEIKVYEKSGEMSEFLGRDLDNDKQFVLDVKLKKEYAHGTMLNLEAGYGTDNRYLGRLFAMHFNAKDRYLFYHNTNNLSDVTTPGQNTSWRVSNNNAGEKDFSQTGFEYSLTRVFKLKGNVSGNLTDQNTEMEMFRQNFFPSGNTFDRRLDITKEKDRHFNTRHSFSRTWKYLFFSVTPKFSLGITRNNSASENKSSYDRDALMLINNSMMYSKSSYRTVNAGIDINTGVKFKNIPDLLTFNGGIDYRNSRRTIRRDYNIFYVADSHVLNENQIFRNHPDDTFNATISTDYSYALSSGGQVWGGYEFGFWKKHMTSNMFLLNRISESTGNYALKDFYEESPDLSNSYQSTELRRYHKLEVQTSTMFGKYEFRATLPVKLVHQHLNYVRGAVPHLVDRSSLAFDNANAIIQLADGKKLCNVSYNLSTRLPDLISMVDIVDDTDPLNLYKGNPSLKNAYSHTISANYEDRKRYQTFALSANITANQITNGYSYDLLSGIRQFQTFNLNGDWMISANYFKDEIVIKLPKGNVLTLRTRTGINYHNAVDMIGDGNMDLNKTDIRNLTVTENFSVNWFSPSPMMNLRLIFDGVWRNSTSPDNIDFTAINAGEVNYGLTYQLRLPANFSFSTDFGAHSRFGYDAKELNSTNIVWNARIACSLCNGKWVIALDGYDLLNQQKNITYSVNPQGRVEIRSNSLPRYALLHVQYRLNLLPK